jgi:hypothetical protein
MFGNYPLASAFIKQVLPIPFLPTSPYFLPNANLTFVYSNKAFPPIMTLILSNNKSLFFPPYPVLECLTTTGGNLVNF